MNSNFCTANSKSPDKTTHLLAQWIFRDGISLGAQKQSVFSCWQKKRHQKKKTQTMSCRVSVFLFTTRHTKYFLLKAVTNIRAESQTRTIPPYRPLKAQPLSRTEYTDRPPGSLARIQKNSLGEHSKVEEKTREVQLQCRSSRNLFPEAHFNQFNERPWVWVSHSDIHSCSKVKLDRYETRVRPHLGASARGSGLASQIWTSLHPCTVSI